MFRALVAAGMAAIAFAESPIVNSWITPSRHCGAVHISWTTTDPNIATDFAITAIYPGFPASMWKWVVVPDVNETSYTTGSYQSPVIRQVTLPHLTPSKQYAYMLTPGVHSLEGNGTFYSFFAPPCSPETVPQGDFDWDLYVDDDSEMCSAILPTSNLYATTRLVLAGDIGTSPHSQATIDAIVSDIRSHNNQLQGDDLSQHVPGCYGFPYTGLLALGDLAYATEDPSGWDTFARMMSPLTSRQPLFVIPGNHEYKSKADTLAFQTRYTHSRWGSEVSPSKDKDGRTVRGYGGAGGGSSEGACGKLLSQAVSGSYYSSQIGSIHVLFMNAYEDFKAGSKQRAFIEGDLQCVNRTRTPMVAVAVHAPLYSSSSIHQDEALKLRNELEQVFVDNGVDAVFSGHVHVAEVTGNVAFNRTDPRGPVYVTTGHAGNPEGLYTSSFANPAPEWSLFRGSDEAGYGFATFEIMNTNRRRGIVSIWRASNVNDANPASRAPELVFSTVVTSHYQGEYLPGELSDASSGEADVAKLEKGGAAGAVVGGAITIALVALGIGGFVLYKIKTRRVRGIADMVGLASPSRISHPLPTTPSTSPATVAVDGSSSAIDKNGSFFQASTSKRRARDHPDTDDELEIDVATSIPGASNSSNKDEDFETDFDDDDDIAAV